MGFRYDVDKAKIRPVCVTDIDFADYIALISKHVKQAQTLLDRVGTAAVIGLMANPQKSNDLQLS